MWLKITQNYSPNFSLPKRPKNNIKFIILHYTGMKKESLAIRRLCDFNSNVSAHYFIKKNGNILNLVPDLYEAWHAGKSSWKTLKSLNKQSIGIEIQNSGHDFRYEDFSLKQIISLKKLLNKLIRLYKIKQNNILGHSDIAPDRKKDPGEKFPWDLMDRKKLGLFSNLNKENLITKKTKINRNKFFHNLSKIGYKYFSIKKSSKNDSHIIRAFQRRFFQKGVTGKIDQKTFKISHYLAGKF